MILYFSGTGNSQRAARQIAERCDDTVFSINQSLRSGQAETLHSDKPLVFVTPIYAWRMPRVVEQWIQKTAFTGNKNTYFVLTCAGECGNAAPYAETLCRKKGLRFCGLADAVMPENYLALFSTPDPAEAERILAASIPQIAALADCIREGTPFPVIQPSLTNRLKSGPVNALFYATTVSDKGFFVDNGCVGCGLCAARCPLLNITMTENRPRWNGTCTHCMACIGGCPTEAIEYKKKSKGQSRYYIMESESSPSTDKA